MLYYGCKDLGLLCWKLKTLVVVVLIFFKNNGLCGRLADSNYFYTEEFCTVHESLTMHKFSCTCSVVSMHNICTVATVHTICEGLSDQTKIYFFCC